jgi:hypothetical protein
VKLDTLLPLGKVDPGLRAPQAPLDLHTVARDAQTIEALGYDGFVVEETKEDPFVVLAHATIGRQLVERFGAVVTHCEFSIAVRNESDRERLAELVRSIHAASADAARAILAGRDP